MNPDLIALCEMPPDQISTVVGMLIQKTGRTWYSHFVPKAPGIGEGNLILSTFNFTSTDSHYLSYTRSIAEATINVGGQTINFFATHLDNTTSSVRLTEADELISWVSGFASARIIAGDLNAANDTPEMARLLGVYRDSWVDVLNQGAAFAYPDNPVWLNTRTRRWRIDYILYSADPSTLAAVRGEIPDIRDLSNTNVVITVGNLDDRGVRPSDHNLVITDFDVASGGTPTPTPSPTPESPNNTRVPPGTQIIDSNGAVWTRAPNGAILRSGTGTGGTGSQILYCNHIVYVLGNDSQWYRWSNGWTPIGNIDPCGSGSPTTPILVRQGNTERAVALQSTLFVAEPFPLTSPINLGSDQRTRILLFALNIELREGEPLSSIVVQATDSRGFTYQLPVEHLNSVANLSWLSEIVVRLPDDQTISGDLAVTISLRGATSNSALIAIAR